MLLIIELLMYVCTITTMTCIAMDSNKCPFACVCDTLNGLKRTKCNGFHLSSIEADVPSEVEFLDFAHNVIHQLSDYSFMKLHMGELVILNVSSNLISDISLYAFAGLKHLQLVDLSDNALQALAPQIFEDCLKLKTLLLAGNKFVSLVPAPFLKSKSIEVLDISKCFIPHFYAATFSELPNLSALDISNNFLIDIKQDVFENLINLKFVNLSGNQWKCTAKMRNIEYYLRNHHVTFQSVCKLKVNTIDKSVHSQKLLASDKNAENMENVLSFISISKSNHDENADTWTSTKNKLNVVNKTSDEIQCKSAIISLFYILSPLLLMMTFIIGMFFGLTVTSLYVLYINKRKKNYQRRSRFNTIELLKRQQKSRPRNREESLLNNNDDIELNCGLSTPVLHRAQLNNKNMYEN